MKVSKKLQKKKKADKRNIAIGVCIVVILGALGVVLFYPSNNTNKDTTIANTTTTTNQNIITTANVNNTVTNSNFTSNSVVTTNASTINQNVVANTNTNTNTTVNTQTQTQTQVQSQTQTQQQDNSSSSNGWNLFNWGSKEVDEDKAKEIAVSEFAKLGENVTKADLQAFPLKRTDGLDYFYIKSTKNTCEVRKDDGVVTRLNANPVNQ